jgi:hypothetical protein
MSTATDGELIARCQRFERRLLEYMDAWRWTAALGRASWDVKRRWCCAQLRFSDRCP